MRDPGQISESGPAPQDLTFGYQRAQLLGAFFNGVFLVALGISILVQSLERFIHLERVNDPELMLVMGCVGLTLNIISALFLHEHHGHEHGHGHDSDDVPPLSTDEQQAWGPDGRSLAGTFHNHAEHRHNTSPTQAPGRDLGMVGVLVHVISDALNNIGVIIAALVIWRTNYHSRYFADPGASMGIAIMILLSSIPLVKNSGAILLQSAPRGVDLADIKHDLEKVDPQILSLGRQEHTGARTDIVQGPWDRIRPRATRLAAGPEEGDCDGTCGGVESVGLRVYGNGEDG